MWKRSVTEDDRDAQIVIVDIAIKKQETIDTKEEFSEFFRKLTEICREDAFKMKLVEESENTELQNPLRIDNC